MHNELGITMRFVNETPWSSFWTLSLGCDGRERMVVVVRATFSLPTELLHDQKMPLEPAPMPEQQPLIEADVYEGEPGLSAPLIETDFAHDKPACDVIFIGNAYARERRDVTVSLGLGSWSKKFRVLGPRTWRQSLTGVSAGTPQAFSVLKLSYAQAFGGTEVDSSDPRRIETFENNPVGVGYHRLTKNVDGLPMPRTEAVAQPVRVPTEREYVPCSFGPIGRSWLPRRKLAGTYDAEWLDRRAPLLPRDFDARYFQCAPQDQQLAFPLGGEVISLSNLTPGGAARCLLPRLRVPVIFVVRNGLFEERMCSVDTVLIEPEDARLSLTARVVYALPRSMFDLSEVVVGGRSHSWKLRQRAAQTGRRYYPSLSELARASRRRAP